jgi:hypothetical protein
MSRNGSGTYTLPAGNPVVPGTTITTTWGNTTLTDIANALTASVAADGQTPMTGALNMANNKVTSLATPTVATDAATKAYVDAKTDGTASGSFTDLAYTGTLTGGTGVVNLGSGQFYKTSGGNIGIGTSSPAKILTVSGADAVFRLIDTNGAVTDIGSPTAGTTFRNFTSGAFKFQNAAGAATLSLDTSGNVIVTGSITTSQTAGIVGTTTNNDANTGSVGEYITANGANITVTTTAANGTSISLTAGDWDVSAYSSSGGASAACTASQLGINTTSATLGSQAIDYIQSANDVVNGASGSMFTKRISLSSTTTVYAVVKVTAGTTVFTQIRLSARRVR